MSRVWIGNAPPRSSGFRHVIPLRRAEIPVEFFARLSVALESIGTTLDPFHRMALLSLLPWFSVWVHRSVEIASGLPDDDELRDLPVVTSQTDSLETALVRVWSRSGVTSSPEGAYRVNGGAMNPKRIASVVRVLAAPVDVAPSDVLFVSLQANSTRSVLPVARILRARGHRVAFAHLALDQGSSEALAQDDFPRVPLERLTPLRALRSFRNAPRILEALMRDPRLTSLLSELPLPSWLSGRRLSEVFAKLARGRFTTALLKGMAVSKALELTAPSAIVFPSDHALLARTATTASKILVLQGIVPPLPPISQQLPVHRALIGSSLDLEYTLSSGIPRESTEIVGYPEYANFDALDATEARTRFFEPLPVRTFRRLVVFTSQYATELFPDWARLRNLEVVVEFAAMNPETLVALKPHPRRESLDEGWLSRLPANVVVPRSGFPGVELMKAADVVLTYWSTTALEALLLGVPLVQLNATGLGDYYPLGARAGLPVARSAEDLNAHVLPLLNSATERQMHLDVQRAYLERAQIPSAASAAERSAAVIESALAERRKRP